MKVTKAKGNKKFQTQKGKFNYSKSYPFLTFTPFIQFSLHVPQKPKQCIAPSFVPKLAVNILKFNSLNNHTTRSQLGLEGNQSHCISEKEIEK